MSPDNFDPNVGAGNTAVLSGGNYPGFTIPDGVTIYSPTVGSATINGNIKCSGMCNIVGLTISNGAIDVSGTSGSRISRNYFYGGNDLGMGFGPNAINGSGSSHLTVDHNEFDDVQGVNMVNYFPSNMLVSQNSFINPGQGIDIDVDSQDYTSTHDNTISQNYFSNVRRMPVEICCADGGTVNTVVDGNWTENIPWDGTNEGDGAVVYSVVSHNQNARVTNNVGLYNGVTSFSCYAPTGHCSIGIEIFGTGLVSHNVMDHFVLGAVVDYTGGNDDGTNSQDSSAYLPPRPQTGPGAP